MNSILFLDIDGVLNTGNTNIKVRENPSDYITWRRADRVEIQKLNLLRQFCALHNIKIVIISSWASNYDYLLSITNFLQLPIVDKIDYTGGGPHRGLSILEYVFRNSITNYAIIDDSEYCYDINNSLLQRHLVLIDGTIGLEEMHLNNVLTIIKGHNERY